MIFRYWPASMIFYSFLLANLFSLILITNASNLAKSNFHKCLLKISRSKPSAKTRLTATCVTYHTEYTLQYYLEGVWLKTNTNIQSSLREGFAETDVAIFDIEGIATSLPFLAMTHYYQVLLVIRIFN